MKKIKFKRSSIVDNAGEFRAVIPLQACIRDARLRTSSGLEIKEAERLIEAAILSKPRLTLSSGDDRGEEYEETVSVTIAFGPADDSGDDDVFVFSGLLHLDHCTWKRVDYMANRICELLCEEACRLLTLRQQLNTMKELQLI